MESRKPLFVPNAIKSTELDAEQQAFSLIAAAGLLPQPNINPQVLELVKNRAEIDELKEQLNQKNTEIEELQKKVKDLEENNNELSINLEGKDKEVKSLRERIQILENEKKELQEELASVKFKLKSIEEEIKKLTKSRECHEERSSKLEGELKKIHFTLKEVKDDLATTKAENETLKKQIRSQARYVPGAPLLMPVQASDEKNAMSCFGEMCCQIQDAMYKRIIPQHFTPIRSYKIKCFTKDIEKLLKTEDEKEQARKRWEDLKTELQWSEDLEETLDALENAYHRSLDTNPPSLYENRLRDYAKFLEERNILKGWISVVRVNRLVDVWKRLAEFGEIACQS